jgi:hypothetical protein
MRIMKRREFTFAAALGLILALAALFPAAFAQSPTPIPIDDNPT